PPTHIYVDDDPCATDSRQATAQARCRLAPRAAPRPATRTVRCGLRRSKTSRPRVQRYTKTGVFVCVRTLFVTLPSTTAESPPRPGDGSRVLHLHRVAGHTGLLSCIGRPTQHIRGVLLDLFVMLSSDCRCDALVSGTLSQSNGSSTIITVTLAPTNFANDNPFVTACSANSDPSVGMRICRYMLHLSIARAIASDIRTVRAIS